MKKVLCFIFIVAGILFAEIPEMPVLKVIHKGAGWNFDSSIKAGISSDINAFEPSEWNDTDTFSFGEMGIYKVFLKYNDSDDLFSAVYNVKNSYPSIPENSSSDAIWMEDDKIKSWATGYENPNYGSDVDEQWQTPERALGVALGNSFDIVCLGRGGEISLTFDPAIANGEGDDFCVFENSFSDDFLEYAFIEVSSNGSDFVRFDCAYIGDDSNYSETKNAGQFAGKYRQGFGTPFDLETLKNKKLVRDGVVDLNSIKYVKIIDLVGDGTEKDSFGNTIYDPYPTMGSAGFDLDAVGVINNVNTVSIFDELILDKNIELISNYPNPFNPETNINFALSKRENVSLKVYNTKGEVVENILTNRMLNAGTHSFKFDGKNLTSGVYQYIIRAGSEVRLGKMVMVK